MKIDVNPDSPKIDVLGAFARIAIGNVLDDVIKFTVNGVNYCFTMDYNYTWTIKKSMQNEDSKKVTFYTRMRPKRINRNFNVLDGSTEYILIMEPIPFYVDGCLDISVVFPKQT